MGFNSMNLWDQASFKEGKAFKLRGCKKQDLESISKKSSDMRIFDMKNPWS
jgi:hypothetical protein